MPKPAKPTAVEKLIAYFVGDRPWAGKEYLAKRQATARRTASSCLELAVELEKAGAITPDEVRALKAAAGICKQAGNDFEIAARKAERMKSGHESARVAKREAEWAEAAKRFDHITDEAMLHKIALIAHESYVNDPCFDEVRRAVCYAASRTTSKPSIVDIRRGIGAFLSPSHYAPKPKYRFEAAIAAMFAGVPVGA